MYGLRISATLSYIVYVFVRYFVDVCIKLQSLFLFLPCCQVFSFCVMHALFGTDTY